MLLGLTIVLTVALSNAALHRMSMLNDLSSDFNTYANVQKIETFVGIIENTRVPCNSPQHESWLNYVYVSAAIDGIIINTSSNATVISTRSMPAVYAVLGNI
jgi:hypothetical protein